MSAEWKGPWKCEKCGYRYVAGVPGGRCRCGEDEETRCTGTLVPYDRRAPAPSADGLREALDLIAYKRGPFTNYHRNCTCGWCEAVTIARDALAALPAPQEAKGEMRGVMTSVTELLDEDVRRELAIDETSGLQLAVVRICNLLQATWNASRAHPAPGLRERVEGLADEWDAAKDSNDGYVAASHDHGMALRALLRSSPASDEVVVDGWIDVTDRLPDEGVEVLTFSEESGHTIHDLAYVDEGVWCASWANRILEEVTHWRPLPEPPAIVRGEKP